jgi:hypothetical protein
MFCRAAFTAPRSLSKRESSGLAWTLLFGGIIGSVVAILWGSGTHRLMLLGGSLSGIGYGLAGLTRRSR